jgi:hypothetical protein
VPACWTPRRPSPPWRAHAAHGQLHAVCRQRGTGTSVTLDGSGSSGQNGASIASYAGPSPRAAAWPASRAAPPAARPRWWPAAGSVTVTLTVTDSRGISASVSQTLTVTGGQSPVAAAVPWACGGRAACWPWACCCVAGRPEPGAQDRTKQGASAPFFTSGAWLEAWLADNRVRIRPVTWA